MSAWKTATNWRGSRDPNPGESQAWPIGELLPTVLARLGLNGEDAQPTRNEHRPAFRSSERNVKR